MAHPRGKKKIEAIRWVGFQANALAMATATPVGVTMITAGTLPETIMRTRGQLFAGVDGLTPPARLIDVAVGFILVPEGTGTTVLWGPITDPNAPWFYYSRFVLGYEEAVVDVVDYPGYTTYRETIDSKAMRIVRPDHELQVVFEQLTIANALPCNVSVSGRFLNGH